MHLGVDGFDIETVDAQIVGRASGRAFLPTSDLTLGRLTSRALIVVSNRSPHERTGMTPNPRTIAGGLAAAVLGGGVTAALLLAPNATSAATPTSTEVTGTDDTGAATDSGDTSARGEALREALQPLVDAGALTEEQADDLVSELLDAVPQVNVQLGRGLPGMPEVPGMPGRHQEGGPLARLTQHSAGVIADTIGIDQADLITQLRDGKTVAEIAQDNGVDPQAVIDALVDDYTQRVTDFVNGDTGSTGDSGSTSDDEAATTTPTTEAAA
jgi:hypothetical protein